MSTTCQQSMKATAEPAYQEVKIQCCDPSYDLRARLWDALAREEEESLADDLFYLMPEECQSESMLASEVTVVQLPKATPAPPGSRKRKISMKKRENRKIKRKVEKMEERDGPGVRVSAQLKHESSSVALFTDPDASQASVSSTGYTGLNTCDEPKRTFTLHELLREKKFKRLRWDGRTRMHLIDSEGRIYAVLAGNPEKGDDWLLVEQECRDALKDAREELYPDGQADHRRGNFGTLRSGVSYGGGQTRPMNMKNVGKTAQVVDRLNGLRCFRRIASFGSSVFRSFAPKLTAYYDEQLSMLYEHDPTLKKPFNSIFTAATYNLGPETVCVPHLDFANLPFGFCVVTSFGDYDPKEGGHMVLWEPKLVIEFPPGSTIFLMSAITTHSNTPIRAHETRYSFTQYVAGGLFRWVDNGFQTVKSFRQTNDKNMWEKKKKADEQRWEFGLNLLTRVPFCRK